MFVRWLCEQAQVGVFLAINLHLVLHHPELQPATLGELLHADIHSFHSMDCHLLLPYGLDGEFLACDLSHITY